MAVQLRLFHSNTNSVNEPRISNLAYLKQTFQVTGCYGK